MIALNLTTTAHSDRAWIYYTDELKYTSNRQLIEEEVERIFKNRVWVEIRYPGYQSPTTLIMSVEKDEIELEMPPDWDHAQKVALLKYRVPGEPWHSLKVHVKRISGGSIFFHFPEIYTISERRSYFRIEVPSGSTAKIIMQRRAAPARRRARQRFFTGIIKDISAGGVCLYPQKTPGIVLPGSHVMVGPVELNLKINIEKTWPLLEIEKAEVVRLSETMLNDRTVPVMALKFHLSHKEEENLVNYIRQRELAIIKSGVE